MEVYLWTEDAKDKAGYIFWKTLMGILYPEVIVESKQNSSKLIKSIQSIVDDGNYYIIAFDHSFDNMQVMRELVWLREACAKHSNIYELNIVSFEYILLEFRYLIQWIFAEEDDFKEQRKNVIAIREKLLEAVRHQISYKEIEEVKTYIKTLERYNIEQLVSKLLFDLTRNTGFEVSKKKLGICWMSSCCGFLDRQEDDLCGLDNDRKDLREKMIAILQGTVLAEELKGAGLEELYA